MSFRKIFLSSVLLGALAVSICPSVAEDSAPVLLNPEKSPMKFLGESPINSPEKQKTLTSKVQYIKKYKKRHVVPKIVQTPVDIDRLIEYNDFDKADELLKIKMNKNPKDIQARALWLVSLAKQCKLDPAQNQLPSLIKANPKNSDLHYAQGIVYFKRTTSSNMVYQGNTENLLADSLSEFKKAIALSPKDARYYNAAGVIALNQGDVQAAKDYFSKAVAIDKTYSSAIDNLGTIDYLNRDYDAAMQKFNDALKYNTGNATAMYHLAQVAAVKGDLATAARHLNNSIYINPKSHAAYNLIGEVYQQQGNTAAAIIAYKKAIELKPEFLSPYLNLAEVYEQRGDGEFAINQLKTALLLNPDFNDAKIKIADISLINQNYDQSIQYYKMLIGVESYNDDALSGLATAYYEKARQSSANPDLASKKDYQKALDYVNLALNANKSSLSMYLAKLKLQKVLNNNEFSADNASKIINSPAIDLISTINKAEAYLSLNNYAQAGKVFDSAVLMVQNPEDKLNLAEILIFHKQYRVSKKVLSALLVQEPANDAAKADLAYINQNQQNAQKLFDAAQSFYKKKYDNAALDYCNRSISLDPENASVYFLRGEIYEKLKNYAQAASDYTIYLDLAQKPINKNKIEGKIKSMQKQMKIVQ